MIKDYWKYDGVALAELIRNGELTPGEVLESAIETTAKVNPILNFACHDLSQSARATAKGPLPNGPFKGVPFALKDIGAQMKGTPYEAGSMLMKGYVSTHDSNLTKRFHDAGLITFIKTTTPEFGAQITCEAKIYGITRNPWHTGHTPGGSSGGSSAAVAAGVLPFAHANDGLGSIRIPAANCGLFGLKVTRQRTPAGPHAAEISGGRGVEFIVSRTVRDSAVLLDAVHGADVGAPHWAPPPVRPYAEELTAKPRKLRIALLDKTFSGKPVHADCAHAVRDTAKLCADLGHHVEEAAPNIDWERYVWAIRLAGSASMTAGVLSAGEMMGRTPSPENLEMLTWLAVEEGKSCLASAYFKATDVYARIQRQLGAFFVDYDILLTPMLSQPPAAIGWLGDPEDDLDIFWDKFSSDSYSPFAGVFNVSGQPAASIPLHTNKEGLPIGTQLVGRFGDEGSIIALSAQLEQARPWIDRLPPVHVKNYL